MNTAAKVFIVLNLLIALGFAYMQMLNYATNENWKRRWDIEVGNLTKALDVQTNLTAKESGRASLAEGTVTNLQTQLTQAQVTSAELEKSITELNAQILDRDAKVSALEKQIVAHLSVIGTLNRQSAIDRERKEELNVIANVAQAVAYRLNVKLAELEDSYNQNKAELTRREETVARLEGELRRKDSYLALLKERDPKLYDDITTSGPPTAPSIIRGMVAAVHTNNQGQQDLVMISVGANAGIERNMEFIIYRDGEYVTRVRVEKVMDNMAAARVLHDFWNVRGLEIAQGDTAQNRMW